LGKFHPEWQAYLLECEKRPALRGSGPDHKGAGVALAYKHLQPLAFLINGHHGGLADPANLKAWVEGRKPEAIERALSIARNAIPDLEPTRRLTLPAQTEKDRRSAEFLLRFAFSALVDADYLDTEHHFSLANTIQRESTIAIPDLWKRFEHNQQQFPPDDSTTLGRIRAEVYDACVASAEQPPGLFRLAVPTGGGKTRSGMAFALRHAMKHGHKRIVVGVPFISITEQTASVYRSIFEPSGDDAQGVVLEHHSGSVGIDSEDFHAKKVWARLAAENWDASIIVTTTVQLFESLFSNKTSQTRKLHRLARSVIILDEAQALPAHLLTPILDALKEVCTYYGATVILSTATQPAFESIPVFAAVKAKDIVLDPKPHFRALSRVSYDWRSGALSWEEAADIVRQSPQALAVLNTKKDALSLLDALHDEAAFHLSTLLCGAHRRKVIEEIKERLSNGAPCRLISTQVIEAGVDLDFPLVLRALGPLDSIIQAAGRCNREGKLPQKGRVVIFEPKDGGMPSGAYTIGTRGTETLKNMGRLDPDDPEAAALYFKRLFETLDTDRNKVQDARKDFNYPRVAELFRMIREDTLSVVVADYGTREERQAVTELVQLIRQGIPQARLIQRRLQPYIVSIRSREARKYAAQGLIEFITPELGLWKGGYDSRRGIFTTGISPDELIV